MMSILATSQQALEGFDLLEEVVDLALKVLHPAVDNLLANLRRWGVLQEPLIVEGIGVLDIVCELLLMFGHALFERADALLGLGGRQRLLDVVALPVVDERGTVLAGTDEVSVELFDFQIVQLDHPVARLADGFDRHDRTLPVQK